MAFDIEKFTSISGQSVQSRGLCKWGYITADAVSVVQATGYFDDIKNQLKEGHLIEVEHVDADGNAVETIEYQVVSKTANVLVVLPKRAGEVMAVGVIDDISTADNIDITFHGGNVALKKVYSVLDGALTLADATLTVDNSDEVSLGTITVAYDGSAAGDIDSLSLNGELAEVGSTFNVATDGGSTGEQECVIVLIGTADVANYGDTVLMQLSVADISGANVSALRPVGLSGQIVGCYSAVSGDPGAETTLTVAINAVSVTGGVITIANGAGAGEIDSATPTALNLVTAADYVKVTSNGGASNAVSAEVTLVIRK